MSNQCSYLVRVLEACDVIGWMVRTHGAVLRNV
jgi:hypothetical protein